MISFSSKTQNGLPFWYRLTQAVLDSSSSYGSRLEGLGPWPAAHLDKLIIGER